MTRRQIHMTSKSEHSDGDAEWTINAVEQPQQAVLPHLCLFIHPFYLINFSFHITQFICRLSWRNFEFKLS